MRRKFIEAIEANQAAFGLDLPSGKVETLADHFELVQEHNPLLHLVAPCPPEEFAVRHVLESLTLLEFLPTAARFADVGPGGGFPSIPCLVVRDDLHGVLIESKKKKTGFLQTAIAKCKIGERAAVFNRQFSEVLRPDVSYIACRALDKFAQNLPKLIKWSGDCTMLLFGGPALRQELQKRGLKFEERLMPLSEQRYLFVSQAVNRHTPNDGRN